MTLAGSPFFISPSELNRMLVSEIEMWLTLSEKRIRMENKGLKD